MVIGPSSRIFLKLLNNYVALIFLVINSLDAMSYTHKKNVVTKRNGNKRNIILIHRYLLFDAFNNNRRYKLTRVFSCDYIKCESLNFCCFNLGNEWLNILFVTGKEEGVWHLDLKNGGGSCGQGEPKNPPDATLTMDSSNFTDMFAGTLFSVFYLFIEWILQDKRYVFGRKFTLFK